MEIRTYLTSRKARLLKRIRANEYTSDVDRLNDIFKLSNIIEDIGPLERISKNDAEIQLLMKELQQSKSKRVYDLRAYTCELEKKNTEPPKKTKKQTTRQLLMTSSGMLSWRKV